MNPPVHAWAALHVWDIDGRRDTDFLARLLPKLIVNFTWWVNRIDPEGDHVFAGGFLGLDHISAVDRSNLPPGGHLEQADGTTWMAFCALNLLHMANVPADRDGAWRDIQVKFLEHYVLIIDAVRSLGLWDTEDAFFYDVYRGPDGRATPITSRSIVGVLPLLATVGVIPSGDGRRVLARVVDEDELLSPHGLRALSRYHADHRSAPSWQAPPSGWTTSPPTGDPATAGSTSCSTTRVGATT